ncbi:MAG: hypothetical protein AAF092_04440 [Pseudomonadota bacterium]
MQTTFRKRQDELAAALEAAQRHVQTLSLSIIRGRFGRRNRFQEVMKRQRRQVVARIKREQQLLVAGQLSPEAAEQTALDWLNAAKDPRQTARSASVDPVRMTGDKLPTSASRAEMEQVLALRDAQEGGVLTSLRPLRQAAGLRTGLIDDLIWSAYWNDRLRDRAGNTVGVLLPARLETRFDQRGTSWHLRLRIIPDEPWMDEHDPSPSKVELRALGDFLTHGTADDVSEELERSAWAEYCGAVGSAARASFLLREMPRGPVAANGAETLAEQIETRENVSGGALRDLPDVLQIYAEKQGSEPELIGRTEVQHDRLTFDLIAPEEPEGPQWWWDWQAAVDAGLAIEIDLGQLHPRDIEALYVVGLSDTSPDRLFEAHADAGQLGAIPLGTPTNAQEGQTTVSFDTAPEPWREAFGGGNAEAHAWDALGLAVLGDETAFDRLPGGDFDHAAPGRAILNALWPAIWGHTLRNILGAGEAGFDLGVWACTWLHPEGGLPALRIGDNPYGVLPVADLEGWQPEDDDPQIEATLLPLVRQIESVWADIAAQDGSGTIVGADSQRLLDLLARTASTEAFQLRAFLPFEFLVSAGQTNGADTTLERALEREWADAMRAAQPLSVDVVRKYLSVGGPAPLRLPLVIPDNYPANTLPAFLQALHRAKGPDLLVARELDPDLPAPDAETPQVPADTKTPMSERVPPNSLLLRLVEHATIVAHADAVRFLNQVGEGPQLTPVLGREGQMPLLRDGRGALNGVALNARMHSPVAQIYRLQKEAVETLARLAATQPLALERALRAVLDCAQNRVDPWVTAFAARRLSQMDGAERKLGLYAWVDRPFLGQPGTIDKSLVPAPSERQLAAAILLRDRALNDPEADRWKMDVRSDKVRVAKWLALEVREGAYFAEAVGRLVEEAIPSERAVKQLRQAFPLGEQTQGRRTCDGLAALDALLADTGSLSPDQTAQLKGIRAGVDTYGDLLLVEASSYLTEGKADRASKVLDAAAGRGQPPEFEAITTDRSGRSVTTELCVILPNGDEHVGDLAQGQGPVRIAEPALVRWLDQRFDPDDSAAWRWVFVSAQEDGSELVESFTLADLGHTPSDTVTIPTDMLTSALQRRTGGGTLEKARSTGPATHAALRDLLPIVSGKPETPVGSGPASASGDARVSGLLAARYTALLAAAERDTLAAAAATDASAEALAGRLRVWGIDTDGTAGAVQLKSSELVTRITAALSELDPNTAATRRPEDIAKAIAELAKSDGRLPIFAPTDAAALPDLHAEDQDADGAFAFDAEWLGTVATVRAPARRIEAHQLGSLLDAGHADFTPAHSRPGDIWQQTRPAGVEPGEPWTSALTVGYLAQPDVLAAHNGQVAVAMLDTWTETVPGTAHDAAAGFGFNAPSARAPQAVLLAVPSTLDRPVGPDEILGSVRAARRLSRARMMAPETLERFAALLPASMMTDEGKAGLDTTSYPRPEAPT